MAKINHGKRHGPITHEQQQRIIQHEEQMTAADIEPVNETIAEAQARHAQPEKRYDMETGERAIDHGANQESEHRKHRST
jgi:Asp-tRNA(Asn)/Glu-tRNA(Gln) amidotransferase C subunit